MDSVPDEPISKKSDLIKQIFLDQINITNYQMLDVPNEMANFIEKSNNNIRLLTYNNNERYELIIREQLTLHKKLQFRVLLKSEQPTKLHLVCRKDENGKINIQKFKYENSKLIYSAKIEKSKKNENKYIKEEFLQNKNNDEKIYSKIKYSKIKNSNLITYSKTKQTRLNKIKFLKRVESKTKKISKSVLNFLNKKNYNFNIYSDNKFVETTEIIKNEDFNQGNKLSNRLNTRITKESFFIETQNGIKKIIKKNIDRSIIPFTKVLHLSKVGEKTEKQLKIVETNFLDSDEKIIKLKQREYYVDGRQVAFKDKQAVIQKNKTQNETNLHKDTLCM